MISGGVGSTGRRVFAEEGVPSPATPSGRPARLDGVVKDVGLMIDAAGRHGFPAGLLEAVRDLYVRASADGHGDDDMAAVAEVFARRPS